MILKCIARTIYILEKQGFPLRDHAEDMIDSETGTDQNPGSFIAFLHKIAQYCPELDNHLKNPLMVNVTYTSPKSRNEMIDDRAPNMQSEKSGTVSWILGESNKAITTHSCSHNSTYHSPQDVNSL